MRRHEEKRGFSDGRNKPFGFTSFDPTQGLRQGHESFDSAQDLEALEGLHRMASLFLPSCETDADLEQFCFSHFVLSSFRVFVITFFSVYPVALVTLSRIEGERARDSFLLILSGDYLGEVWTQISSA